MSSGRKKIVRLFSRLNVGGPALHVVNLSKGLSARGYETVLAVGLPDSKEGSMEGYAAEQGVALERIPGFQAALSPWRDLRAAFAIYRLLRRERPDIVHTHTFKAGLLGRLAARLAGVPHVVHTYHGHLLHGYWTGWKARLIVVLERILGAWTDRIIAVSKQVGDDLIGAGVVDPKKLDVVTLGFDIEKFTSEASAPSSIREKAGIPVGATVIAIVGRLVPIKNVDLFLEALCPLLGDYPNLHLAVVGDGSERSRLQALAAWLCDSPGALNRVHFLGFVMPMAPEWKAIDLCLCTSRNEGTSVSIIEAVMSGVPVMSTAVGGMPDLLENGRWGRLFEESAERVRDSVQAWLRARSGPPAGAAEFFRDRFSDVRLIDATERIYLREGP